MAISEKQRKSTPRKLIISKYTYKQESIERTKQLAIPIPPNMIMKMNLLSMLIYQTLIYNKSESCIYSIIDWRNTP